MPATPFLGQVIPVPYNFAPNGWALCNGQLLPIAQNTALFSLLGVNFGGDGKSTFGLPNLQNFPSFRVTLLQRLGNGLPGAVIDQETFATASTSPADTGLLSFNNTKVWQQTVTLANLPTLTAGQYMISIGVAQPSRGAAAVISDPASTAVKDPSPRSNSSAVR